MRMFTPLLLPRSEMGPSVSDFGPFQGFEYDVLKSSFGVGAPAAAVWGVDFAVTAVSPFATAALIASSPLWIDSRLSVFQDCLAVAIADWYEVGGMYLVWSPS